MSAPTEARGVVPPPGRAAPAADIPSAGFIVARGAAYYNEIEPFAAQWLRNLIAAGLIASGDVDERSIVDVQPDDLRGYAQCHFFAGIGGWSYALRLAGWPDDAPAWSGSCPCQPLSSAGQRKGHADERHLWPAFHRLIAECRPATVFGEQVASKDGREWLAGIRADLEAVGYACGAADLCAAGVGAPHIRQRIFWVADAASHGREQAGRDGARMCRAEVGGEADRPSHGGAPAGLALTSSWRRGQGRPGEAGSLHGPLRAADGSGVARGLGDAASAGREEQRRQHRPSGAGRSRQPGPAMQDGVPEWNGPTVAIQRADGWARIAAQPALFPVAPRIPGDVGRLRGSGNAIVPQVAAEFVAAFMECAP
jgi:DNA (cytosine-5)-methyltransferase 1